MKMMRMLCRRGQSGGARGNWMGVDGKNDPWVGGWVGVNVGTCKRVSG